MVTEHTSHIRTRLGVSVLMVQVLILKILSPNGFASHAVTPCDVTPLADKTRLHAMKRASLEVQSLATCSNTLLTCTIVVNIGCKIR